MPRLTGDYTKDREVLDRVVALAFGTDGKVGAPVAIAPTAGLSGRLRLDCVVVPFKAGPVTATFGVDHTLGRVPTLWWVTDIDGPTFLSPVDKQEWSATRVTFYAGLANVRGLILLA